MIENIRTIAKIIRENNASVNNPYITECYKVEFLNDAEGNKIWLYIDTRWKCEYKKHIATLKKVFNAREVVYIEPTAKNEWSFWAVRLK